MKLRSPIIEVATLCAGLLFAAPSAKAEDTATALPIQGIFNNAQFGSYTPLFPSMETCLAGANRIRRTVDIGSGLCLDAAHPEKSRDLQWNRKKSQFELAPPLAP